VRRILHPLAEILLLVVCGTIADCDDYDHIAAWGEAHLDFLRCHLPYHNGVPGGRWLTILMNRVNPVQFSAVFTAWVRATWPGPSDGALGRDFLEHASDPSAVTRLILIHVSYRQQTSGGRQHPNVLLSPAY
jgi:hypothetical protein